MGGSDTDLQCLHSLEDCGPSGMVAAVVPGPSREHSHRDYRGGRRGQSVWSERDVRLLLVVSIRWNRLPHSGLRQLQLSRSQDDGGNGLRTLVEDFIAQGRIAGV